jgi:SnoaL-like protein
MDDRIDIAGLIGALAVHIDARCWADLEELFASELKADWTSLFGGEAQVLKREQLIGNWRQMLPGFTHTTHVIGPPTVALSGEKAQASASVVAWHFIKEPELEGNDFWLAGGTYEIDFAKLDGRWRISAMTLARAWSSGNQDLPRLAGERAKRNATT